MGLSNFDPGAANRRLWNAGRLLGSKRALKPQQVWAIRFLLDREGHLRDRALFDLAINSKLRGCDIVKMRIGDVYQRRPDKVARNCCSAKNRQARSIRIAGASSVKLVGLAGTSWRLARRFCFPKSSGPQ